jgi:hypothetical protein
MLGPAGARVWAEALEHGSLPRLVVSIAISPSYYRETQRRLLRGVAHDVGPSKVQLLDQIPNWLRKAVLDS